MIGFLFLFPRSIIDLKDVSFTAKTAAKNLLLKNKNDVRLFRK